MAFDLRAARGRDATLPPPIAIIELPRRTRVRWARVAGLAVAVLGSAALWALILGTVFLLLR
jgi:hypothetical protein